MVARRVKVLNSDLDRLNELKAGRKDLSLGFNLSSTLNNPTNASGHDNKDNSNDTETKVILLSLDTCIYFH